MKLLYGLNQIAMLPDFVVASIGNFDGVHRGHQALLAKLRTESKRLHCPVLIILFEPQPLEYFQGHQAPVRLMRLRDKLQVLSTLGVDYVCCLKFNEHLAQMPADLFAQQVIFKSLRVNYLVTGKDFCFGKNRAGTVDLLASLGQKHGCTVETFSDFVLDEERVSSTGIRHALMHGDFAFADSCLGRPYSILGRVIEGEGRGRQWGLPTANIAVQRALFPLSGVFSVYVRRKDKPTCFGVANIGKRPTVSGSQLLSLEVHLFDFNESIYGEMLQVVFVSKLRDEKKFSSVELLIDQIHQDIYHAREHLETNVITT